MECLHCNDIITLDDVTRHKCFVEEEKYNESNSSFVEKKEPAIWDQNATLALLSLYEAKIGMLDHPKKKGKIWEAISIALQQNFGIEMSIDQVRWKMNALIKKYKACVDNNSKSGRSLMTFKWFNQMEEIFNQGKGKSITDHTFSSKFMNTAKPSTSSMSEVHSNSSISTSVPISDILFQSSCSENSQNISKSVDSTSSTKSKNKRSSHGTNSNIARNKVALENQWLEYMKMKVERDKICDEKHVSVSEHRKELLKLKRKYLAAKEEEIKQRKEYLIAKLRGKENRHAEIIEIEKKKYKLLRKLVKASSDSD